MPLPGVEMGKSVLAQVRFSCSSKESIDEISPWYPYGTRQQRLYVEHGQHAPVDQVEHRVSSFGSFAENEELLLGTSEKILKATLLPEGEAIGHLGRGAKTWYRGQEELRTPLFQPREVVTAAGHALPALRRRQLEGFGARCWLVEDGSSG